MRPPKDLTPGQNEKPPELRDIHIEQKLDAQLPLDLTFRDEAGREVKLGDYFGNRPVIVTPVYYTCPMLCNQVLSGVVGSLKTMSLDVGKDFDVVAFSIDPRDAPETALAKKQSIVKQYNRPGAADGWHFLTGNEKNIEALAQAVGFNYRYDEKTGQYIHASGIMVATPQGRLSHYFYGIEYWPKDLRLSLVEASANKIGSPVDQLLLYCFHYDPTTGKYGPVVMNIMRIAGLVTFIGLALIVLVMKRRQKAKGKGQEAKGAMGEQERFSTFSFFLFPFAFLQIPFAPEQASTLADDVDALYLFLVALTTFFAILIPACIIYFAVKFRRRSDEEYPKPIEGSTKLEIVWSVIPFIVVMFIFVWGASVYFAMYRIPEEALDIYVVGKQWMWKFQHPDGRREINELHVPIGRRVKLTMGTEDVIHSLYVPAFRIKTDVVPGRLTTIWWEPTRPGRYHLFCAEYCGTEHSRMIGSIIVQEPAEYEAWLSGGDVGERVSSAQAGQQVFEAQACNTCHLEGGGAGRGPALAGVFGKQVQLAGGQTVIADENYIRESILNPRAKVVAGYDPIMPTYQGLLSEEQVLQLIAYIKSLNAPQGGDGSAQPGTGGGATQSPAGSSGQ
ncbi:MAG TPA: cytochrome c oxidase subunit II [Blastocatellia bacterium]|nr:cytochrome c oxidase subunit II [Blastocatellia bacterium]